MSNILRNKEYLCEKFYSMRYDFSFVSCFTPTSRSSSMTAKVTARSDKGITVHINGKLHINAIFYPQSFLFAATKTNRSQHRPIVPMLMVTQYRVIQDLWTHIQFWYNPSFSYLQLDMFELSLENSQKPIACGYSNQFNESSLSFWVLRVGPTYQFRCWIIKGKRVFKSAPTPT